MIPKCMHTSVMLGSIPVTEKVTGIMYCGGVALVQVGHPNWKLPTVELALAALATAPDLSRTGACGLHHSLNFLPVAAFWDETARQSLQRLHVHGRWHLSRKPK